MKHRYPVRLVPLSGVVFAALVVAGDLTIGKFPDPNASISKLTSFYAASHARVAAGGWLYGVAAVFLAIFGATIWLRIRATDLHPIVAAATLVGAAITASAQLTSANAYSTLGEIGHQHGISPAALQAWHISGSVGGGIDGGMILLLLAAATAGIAGHALPRSLAWPALALAVLQLTPLGFIASLLTLAWAALTGVVMFLHPDDTAPTTARDQSETPRPAPAAAHT
jgi:hypothetical protein